MRKVIDLCLDMPMGAEALTNMLSAMCLDPLYRGYKKTYGAGVAAQVGLTVEEIDAIYESEGRDGFLRIIREAAEKHAVKPAEFVRHLDEVGVEWGITCDGDHDNRKTAEIVQAFPKKFKGFIYVDPNRGEEAVRELEVCVKEYGLHALYLTAFRTKLNAADKKNYPLYSKACELGIPVHIYSSLNLSKAVPYDIGHPRYIDQVARDATEAQQKRLNLIVNIVVSVAAVVCALAFTNVIDLLSVGYTIMLSGTLVPLLGGIIWKRGTTKGAAASAAVGMITALLSIFGVITVPFSSIFPVLPAIAAYIVVSLCTKHAPTENTARVAEVVEVSASEKSNNAAN